LLVLVAETTTCTSSPICGVRVPAVSATAMSAAALTSFVVTIPVLLAGFRSVDPGADAVAVLVIGPLALAVTVPLTVSVSTWPAPGARLAPAKLTLLPTLPSTPQLPVPVTAQDTVTPVIDAGTRSVMVKPLATDGPALVTVIM